MQKQYIESPQGVFRQDGKIVKVTQVAINNFALNRTEASTNIWGDAKEIGDEAFAGLDLSPLKQPKTNNLYAKKKMDKFLIHGMNEWVSTNEDLHIPDQIETIGNRALKGCKGAEAISIGSRYFDSRGTNGHGYGAKRIGDEAFADMEGLQAVFVGQQTTEVEFGDNVFAGNNFVNEVRHYSQVFGGFVNDLWGFSADENIGQKISSGKYQAINVESIPEGLIQRDTSKRKQPKQGPSLADFIEK